MRAREGRYDLKVASLESLRELYAWMREENILYARCGELELRLKPKAPAPPPPLDPVSEADEQRRDLEDLLHSSNVSVDALLEMTKGRA